MNDKQTIQTIVAKIEAKEPLSNVEEFTYLTEVMGHTAEEANTIIAIADNKDKTVLID